MTKDYHYDLQFGVMIYVCTVCGVVVPYYGAAPDPVQCSEGRDHEFATEGLKRSYDALRDQKFGTLNSMRDKRVGIFEEKGSISTPSFTSAVRNDPYWGKCAVCGKKNRSNSRDLAVHVTRAHILINSNKKNHKDIYKQFGIAGGYTSEFDGFSPRNHVPLCGTEGTRGTCHDAFDTYKLALVYNPLTRMVRVHWPGSAYHDREFVPSAMPYRRLLNFRSRYQAMLRQDVDLLNLCNLAEGAEPSEADGPSSKKAKKHAKGTSAATAKDDDA